MLAEFHANSLAWGPQFPFWAKKIHSMFDLPGLLRNHHFEGFHTIVLEESRVSYTKPTVWAMHTSQFAVLHMPRQEIRFRDSFAAGKGAVDWALRALVLFVIDHLLNRTMVPTHKWATHDDLIVLGQSLEWEIDRGFLGEYLLSADRANCAVEITVPYNVIFVLFEQLEEASAAEPMMAAGHFDRYSCDAHADWALEIRAVDLPRLLDCTLFFLVLIIAAVKFGGAAILHLKAAFRYDNLTKNPIGLVGRRSRNLGSFGGH